MMILFYAIKHQNCLAAEINEYWGAHRQTAVTKLPSIRLILHVKLDSFVLGYSPTDKGGGQERYTGKRVFIFMIKKLKPQKSYAINDLDGFPDALFVSHGIDVNLSFKKGIEENLSCGNKNAGF